MNEEYNHWEYNSVLREHNPKYGRKLLSSILHSRWKDNQSITLKGHSGTVTSLRFVDDEHLVSSDDFGTVRFWNLKSQSSIRITAHSKVVNCVNVTPNRILSVSNDKTLKIWDIGTITSSSTPVQTLFGHQSFITWCEYEHQRQIIISTSIDGSIRMWNESTDGEIFRIQSGKPIYHVVTVPNVPNLLVTAGDNGILLWDMRKHQSYMQLLDSHKESSDPLTQEELMWGDNPSNNVTNNASSSLWNFGETIETIEEPTHDSPVAKLEDENKQKSKVFNTFTKSYERSFNDYQPNELVHTATFSHDGNYLVTVGKTIKLWDVKLWTGMYTYKKLKGNISHCKIKPCITYDDNYILCGAQDGRLRIWETFNNDSHAGGSGNNTLVLSNHSFPITANVVSNDGSIVTGDSSGLIKINPPYENFSV